MRGQINTATYEYTLNGFPPGAVGVAWGGVHADSEIRLPRPPFQELTKFEYRQAEDGAWVDVDPLVYTLDAGSSPARIYLNQGQFWPGVWASEPNTVRVTYKAGYKSRAEVPDDIRHAILLWVGHYWENRENSSEANLSVIPDGARAILNPYRVFHSFEGLSP